MRTPYFLLVLLTSSLLAERPKPAREVEILLGSAPAAPPELAADILLRLADGSWIPSKEQRLETIEQAFEMAAHAKYSSQESAAVGAATNSDSGPGIRDSALRPGLSSLSLRCRAVRLALPIDKPKARELFERIRLGPFPKPGCKDALVPDVAEYYQTLREVALNTFTAKERSEERHLDLVEGAVRRATIPRQIRPIALLLGDFPMPAERFGAMSVVLSDVIEQMDAGPRAFEENALSAGQSVMNLARLAAKQTRQTLPLPRAFRSYLVRHLSAPRCAEAAEKYPAEAMKQLVEETFNRQMLTEMKIDSVEPIDIEKLKPESLGGAAEFETFWMNDRSRQIMANYKNLRFGTKEQQAEYNKRSPRQDGLAHFLPEETRRSPEWEARAREHMQDLDKWRRNHSDSETAFFHQMCFQYSAMLAIVPPGPLHQSVIEEYVAAVKASPVERESPPEWLLHVARLLKSSAEASEEIRKNGSPAMSLYADLARLTANR